MQTTTWVKESRFGIWFLNTYTWQERVLKRAVEDLYRLLPDDQKQFPVIVDIGCGRGHSLPLLDQFFKPKQINAIEIDASLLPDTQKNAAPCQCAVNLLHGNAEKLPFPDQSVDMVFCHQSFHHIVEHDLAMQEFYRVLKPGGVLLFAESCKKFIYSFLIRLLFRHPMHVQKTAEQYLDLIRQVGFQVNESAISKPYIWWSRSDVGALEWLGFKVPEQREDTLLNLVAVKAA